MPDIFYECFFVRLQYVLTSIFASELLSTTDGASRRGQATPPLPRWLPHDKHIRRKRVCAERFAVPLQRVAKFTNCGVTIVHGCIKLAYNFLSVAYVFAGTIATCNFRSLVCACARLGAEDRGPFVWGVISDAHSYYILRFASTIARTHNLSASWENLANLASQQKKIERTWIGFSR